MTNLYDLDDAPLADIPDMELPDWIESDITVHQVAAILEVGCASGAYMPAVPYYTANQTMAENGNAVLDYLEGYGGELPNVPDGISWSGIASLFLSSAVELWCSLVEDEIADLLLEDGPC